MADQAEQVSTEQSFAPFDAAAYSKLSREEKGRMIADLFVRGMNEATTNHTPTP